MCSNFINDWSRRDHPSFLLESANGTNATARYSFFGNDPYLTLSGRATRTTRSRVPDEVRTHHGSAFDALQQALADSAIAQPDGLPPFFGGAVGYLGYDLVRSFESLPTLAPMIFAFRICT